MNEEEEWILNVWSCSSSEQLDYFIGYWIGYNFTCIFFLMLVESDGTVILGIFSYEIIYKDPAGVRFEAEITSRLFTLFLQRLVGADEGCRLI